MYRKGSGGNAGSLLTLESAAFGGGLLTPAETEIAAKIFIHDVLGRITPNFVNQIYYNKEYIYPPKIINIDYWNSN